MKTIALSLAAMLLTAMWSGAAYAASECEANYKSDNSNSVLGLLAPTTATYQSHAVVHGVAASAAFTRAYREIISDGLTISSSDRDAGAITATAIGNGGENRIALNLLITDQADGVDISVKITASAGGMGHPMKHGCAPIEAAAAN